MMDQFCRMGCENELTRSVLEIKKKGAAGRCREMSGLVWLSFILFLCPCHHLSNRPRSEIQSAGFLSEGM